MRRRWRRGGGNTNKLSKVWGAERRVPLPGWGGLALATGGGRNRGD